MDGATPIENPYVRGLYAPVHDEITRHDCEVIGEIPKDFGGVYVRNGPNPRYTPVARHHWFDGDGMLHAVHIENGKATYRNRYTRTADFDAETEAGHELFGGIMHPLSSRPTKPFKDTSNTDVVFHAGHLLTMWYVAGEPYKVHPITLETIGPDDFGGKLPRNVSAHSKNDPRTGEFLFFDYSPAKPWLTYGVVSPGDELDHFTEIELPGPRLPHDMGMTENYVVLMDLPLFTTPEGLKRGKWQVGFYPDLPSRFGVLPRRGNGADIQWFEAEPCYIYHPVNAWEEGDWIVMDGFRVDEPCPPMDNPNDGDLARMLRYLRLVARMYRWRFNLKTGECKEEGLDGRNAEFPTINWTYLGRKTRYSYDVTIPLVDTLRFDGLMKFDHETGAAEEYKFGEGVFGSEAPFAPRHNSASEDDGYVVTFVQDENSGRSEMLIIDAQDFAKGPVARVQIPQRVPAGFHACWVTEAELAQVA